MRNRIGQKYYADRSIIIKNISSIIVFKKKVTNKFQLYYYLQSFNLYADRDTLTFIRLFEETGRRKILRFRKYVFIKIGLDAICEYCLFPGKPRNL